MILLLQRFLNGFKRSRIPLPMLLIVLALTGCATSPPIPKIESKIGDKIGVFVESGNTPTHTHVGTTVFNNFVRKYDYDWQLNAAVTDAVKSGITKSGFAPVDLRGAVTYSDLIGLTTIEKDGWSIPAAKQPVVDRLRAQFDLKAIVVLKEQRSTVFLECGGGPCNDRQADASGLFSRSVFGIDRFIAVPAYKWSFVTFAPTADIATSEEYRQLVRYAAAPLPGFQAPANFDSVTQAEFAPVREAILKYVEGVTQQLSKGLNGK